MLKGEVRITIGGFDGFTQMMGHCYADCYRFPFSVLTLSSLLPLGDVGTRHAESAYSLLSDTACRVLTMLHYSQPSPFRLN